MLTSGMDWKDIPSLSALRAFDAVARMGSLSAAARALGLSRAQLDYRRRKLGL